MVHRPAHSDHGPDGVEEESASGGLKKNCGTRFCELQEKFPIASVLGGAVIGILLGIGLSYWQPDDSSARDVVITWIGLIGDLFIPVADVIETHNVMSREFEHVRQRVPDDGAAQVSHVHLLGDVGAGKIHNHRCFVLHLRDPQAWITQPS